MRKELTAAEKLERFCKEKRITFTPTCVDAGDYDKPSKWKITIERNGQKHVFDYTAGASYREWKKSWNDNRMKYAKGERIPTLRRPTLWWVDMVRKYSRPATPTNASLIYCLAMDCSDFEFNSPTFEQWASEFGYDEDSRKAERIYNACRDQWLALRRLGFTAREYEFIHSVEY